MKIWRTLEADPLFQHPQTTLSMDEERHLAVRQMYRVKQYNFLSLEEVIADTRKVNNDTLQQGKLHDFHYGTLH
jgi:NifB/MoaA-like Fe-S oxidoreductase